MRITVQLARTRSSEGQASENRLPESRSAESRSIELGPNLTLIRRIRGEGITITTAAEPVAAQSVAALESELDRIAAKSDISALKAERRATEGRWTIAHEKVLDLQETQFQLLWNVAQLWIAAMVLFPLPLLFWSWDELFGHFVPHILGGLAAAGSVYFLKDWWANRPAHAELESIFLELDLSLIGIDDQLAEFPPLVVNEPLTAACITESLDRFVALLNRFSPARDIVVLSGGEPGRALSRRLVDQGGEETSEGDELAVTRA